MRNVARILAAVSSLGAAAFAVVFTHTHDATPTLLARAPEASACVAEEQQEPVHFVNCGGFF